MCRGHVGGLWAIFYTNYFRSVVSVTKDCKINDVKIMGIPGYGYIGVAKKYNLVGNGELNNTLHKNGSLDGWIWTLVVYRITIHWLG